MKEKHLSQQQKPQQIRDTPTVQVNDEVEGTTPTIPLPYQLKISSGGIPLDETSPLCCIGSEVGNALVTVAMAVSNMVTVAMVTVVMTLSILQDGELVLINWLPGKNPETGKPARKIIT